MDSNSLIFYKHPAPVTHYLASQLDWPVLSFCPLVLQGVMFKHCITCQCIILTSLSSVFVCHSCKQVPPALYFCRYSFRNFALNSLFLSLHAFLFLPSFRTAGNEFVSSRLALRPGHTALTEMFEEREVMARPVRVLLLVWLWEN